MPATLLVTHSMRFSDRPDVLSWMLAGRVADAVAALAQTGCLEALRDWITDDCLARSHKLDPAGLATLLHLLVKAGFVDRQGEQYRWSEQALSSLDFIAIELRLRQLFAAGGGLTAGLRGRLYDPLDTLDDPNFIAAYAATMQVNARPLALAIRRIFGPLGNAAILDLGGADGAMIHELSKSNPHANATVVDRAVMRKPFERLHSPGGASSRCSFVAADIKVPESYRALIAGSRIIVLSNVAHLIGLACVSRIMREIRACAPQDCRVVIYDMFVTEEGPVGFADLAAIDWVAGGHGFVRTVTEVAGMIAELGFSVRSVHPVPLLPGSMIIASAP